MGERIDEASFDADVIVVGCGPTGVMAALRCAQRGLTVIAIDRTTEIYPLPRAIGMDAEGQRLFTSAGLGSELASFSTPMLGAEFVTADRERVVGFDLPPGFVTPLGHPPVVGFDQPMLEAALRSAASGAGVDLRLGVEAIGLDNRPEGVRLTTTQGVLTARWLIGADGASSWVRSSLEIELDDQGFDQPWLVVDTTQLDPDLGLSPIVQQICDPDRVVTFVIGHGTRRRWEFQLAEHESSDDMLRPATIATLLAPWGDSSQLRVDRAAVYRFHGLVATTMRTDSTFLVGDSAHQMPPFNGQGMCSGLRDADNLAWKLELVHLGLLSTDLLDSYDAERRPHAVATVEHACDAGRLIDAIAAGTDISTDAGYGGGRGTPFLMSGVIDGDHRAVGRPAPQPVVDGTRLDHLVGDRFALLQIKDSVDDHVPEIWARLDAATVQVDETDIRELQPGETMIVRPDRYVAAVTSDLATTTERLLGSYSV